MTQTPSFRRSRDLDKSNKFRQMQESTNDYYSVIKLHNILHIRPLNLVLIKKNQQLHSGYQYWNDNEAATDHGGVMADSCIRRMAHCVSDVSRTRNGGIDGSTARRCIAIVTNECCASYVIPLNSS